MQHENRQETASGQSMYDLKHFVAVIIRRRWLIAAIALPIILIVTIGTLRTANTVTASTMLMVETRQPENPVFYQRSVNETMIMGTAAQIGMSIPVAVRAAELLADSVEVFRREDPILAEMPEGSELAGWLAEGIDCGQIGESTVLHMSYTHVSPRFALAAVEALGQGFLEYNTERLQNPNAVSYYTDQISSVQAEVDSLMGLRAAAMEVEGIETFTGTVDNNVTHIRVMEQELFKQRATRRGLEGELEKLKDTIAVDPMYVPADSRFNLLKQIYETEKAALSKLSVRYKDGSVWMNRQEAIVDDALGSVFRERDSYIAELEIELARLISGEEALMEAVEQQREAFAIYPQVAQRVDSYNMQISSRQNLLENLQLKRGEVRLKAGSDQRISNLVPLNRPSIDNRIGSSKKMLYIAVTFIFALALGLIVAIFVDNQDHRIFGRRQATQVLEVPVLGSVSTPESQ